MTPLSTFMTIFLNTFPLLLLLLQLPPLHLSFAFLCEKLSCFRASVEMVLISEVYAFGHVGSLDFIAEVAGLKLLESIRFKYLVLES